MQQESMPTGMVNASEFTIWDNPTKHIIRFRIWIDANTHKFSKEQWANGARPRKYKDYAIPPGGSVQIESIYDQAIQKTDKDGVVQSGLAPQLRKRGQPAARIDPSLDPSAAKRRELQEKLEHAQETAALATAIIKEQANFAPPTAEDDPELVNLQRQLDQLESQPAQPAAKGKPGK